MDKAYLTLFSACEEAIKHAQFIMFELQKAQLTAEEIYCNTPSPDDEVEPTE